MLVPRRGPHRDGCRPPRSPRRRHDSRAGTARVSDRYRFDTGPTRRHRSGRRHPACPCPSAAPACRAHQARAARPIVSSRALARPGSGPHLRLEASVADLPERLGMRGRDPLGGPALAADGHHGGRGAKCVVPERVEDASQMPAFVPSRYWIDIDPVLPWYTCRERALSAHPRPSAKAGAAAKRGSPASRVSPAGGTGSDTCRSDALPASFRYRIDIFLIPSCRHPGRSSHSMPASTRSGGTRWPPGNSR